MFTDEQIEKIIDLLTSLSDDTKLYFGCDSQRYKKHGEWWAKYATVFIVHMNGKNGCKIFRTISHEKDYDQKKNRPAMRLMNEVRKTAELYMQLAPYVDNYDIEIHLDINPDEKHGSSCVASQAAGYILGMTQIQPKLKPDSWASSFGADGIHRGFDKRSESTVTIAAV